MRLLPERRAREIPTNTLPTLPPARLGPPSLFTSLSPFYPLLSSPTRSGLHQVRVVCSLVVRRWLSSAKRLPVIHRLSLSPKLASLLAGLCCVSESDCLDREPGRSLLGIFTLPTLKFTQKLGTLSCEIALSVAQLACVAVARALRFLVLGPTTCSFSSTSFPPTHWASDPTTTIHHGTLTPRTLVVHAAAHQRPRRPPQHPRPERQQPHNP